MRFGVGSCYAQCPYCGAMEFVDSDERLVPSELACARCGAHASRSVVLAMAREQERRSGAHQPDGKE